MKLWKVTRVHSLQVVYSMTTELALRNQFGNQADVHHQVGSAYVVVSKASPRCAQFSATLVAHEGEFQGAP